MRILYLSHERKMGGANRSLYELNLAMKNRGHQVWTTVLFKNCPLSKELSKAGIETVPCFYGWWMEPQNWPWILKIAFRTLHKTDFLAAKKLAKFVVDHDIDIIHSNSSTINMGILVKKMVEKEMKKSVGEGADKKRVKLVFHIREYGDIDYQLEYMDGRKRAVDEINKHVDRVICISKALRNYYSDIVNASVIYNGLSKLDCDFQYIKTEVVEQPTFILAGNLIPGKNQRMAIEAAHILKEKGIHNFKLLLAGTTTALKESKEYEKELISCIEKYDLDNNVTPVGYVKDMKGLRKKAECEIVASKAEAYGRITLEAMFANNLVIAASSGSGPELVGIDPDTADCENGISWGERGIIFFQEPQIDKDAGANNLANAMKEVIDCYGSLEKKEKITDRIVAAQKYVIHNHRTELAAEQVEKLYQEL